MSTGNPQSFGSTNDSFPRSIPRVKRQNRSVRQKIEMQAFTESVVEEAALGWLKALGYAVLHGPDMAVRMPGAERSDPNYRDARFSRCWTPTGEAWH